MMSKSSFTDEIKIMNIYKIEIKIIYFIILKAQLFTIKFYFTEINVNDIHNNHSINRNHIRCNKKTIDHYHKFPCNYCNSIYYK